MRHSRHNVPRSTSRLLGLAIFLWPVLEAAACPVCTQGRLLETYWHLKLFAVLLAAPVLVTFTRLDPVRVLYTFVPLVLVNIKLTLLALWYGHPAANTPGVLLTPILVLQAASTLSAPVLICCLGKFAFYSKNGQTGFLVWQPFAYCGLVWILLRYLSC